MLALFPPSTAAQTIADYSRAQRSLLESTMVQAAARSAGLGASAPAAGPGTPAPVAAAPALPAPHAPSPPMAPAVQVSGVFASRDEAIAEVVVNATPYLLGAGQGVPGTAWHVESITIDRVVLSRRGSTVAAADAEAARKVFALPASR
jgi:type IV pilus biogenesis protein PilP